MQEKDAWKCFTTIAGELCVMMDSLMQRRESFATLWDLGMLRHGNSIAAYKSNVSTYIYK